MTTNPLVTKLRLFFNEAGRNKAVLGLSGGVDSAVVLKLCADALGPSNVLSYFLPYFDIKDDELQSKDWTKFVGTNLEIISIKKPVDALCDAVDKCDATSKGNFMTRVRMSILYDQARQYGALVVGTGNKSELTTGYFTKYGDGGADVLPIGNLYKTDVWKLAREIGVPRHFIEKAPSAGLWLGQTDEGELGITYHELDDILRMFESKSGNPIRKYGEEKIRLLLERIKMGEHKRKLPPIL